MKEKFGEDKGVLMFNIYKNYWEFLFLALVVIGIVVALLSPSAVISYIIILISGIFAGRLIYSRKNKIRFPYFMIIAGFAIGYLIGVYYGNKIIAALLFAIGAVLGYKLFDKKILKDTKY